MLNFLALVKKRDNSSRRAKRFGTSQALASYWCHRNHTLSCLKANSPFLLLTFWSYVNNPKKKPSIVIPSLCSDNSVPWRSNFPKNAQSLDIITNYYHIQFLSQFQYFPADFKNSSIIPIPKTSPPSPVPSDYRPISLLSIPSKLLQRQVNFQPPLLCYSLWDTPSNSVDAAVLERTQRFALRVCSHDWKAGSDTLLTCLCFFYSSVNVKIYLSI